ncbi:acylphosphatase-2-like [Mizuhopecten yessoensis]|uniref:acylphosphatase-2-like n=1 Tax=Mizuhopecten yessoensis TaxID=6573 RepID=UPI000B45F202|nr:acylphosphatase-2-like [Mizuhopecten yessoensis]
MSESADRFVSVDYEIYGNVQGVFFRQHTFERARKVGAVGWVMNTAKGTVKGTVQGTQKQVANMRHFLTHEGSPLSRITKYEFTNDRELVKLEYNRFSITAGDW